MNTTVLNQTITTTVTEVIRPQLIENATVTSEIVIKHETKEIKVPQISIKNQTFTNIVESVEVIVPKIDMKNQTFNYTQTIVVQEPTFEMINETVVITENISISKPKIESWNETISVEEVKIN